MKIILAEKLWGSQAKPWLLFTLAGAIIFAMLTNNELWTVESRWAAVCLQMLLKNDFFHPYRYCGAYYDKPLLSYWLIIGVAKLIGTLNELALRLPAAISGFFTVVCTYSLGKNLFNRNVGLTAGWLLISTYFFIFWSRVSSADMLNVLGIVVAILWYVKSKTKPSFFRYLIFFLIMALTSLCKGLLGFVIPILVISPDLIINKEWKQHIRPSLLVAFMIGVFVYLLPFILSVIFPDASAPSSGLPEVFHENIVRFFQPFDHQDPLYNYFIFLPIYTFPWILLFIPAAINLIWQWRGASHNIRWLFFAILIIFAFLAISGSRRTYYLLPLVPLVMLFIANWINSDALADEKKQSFLKNCVVIIYLALFAWFSLVQHLLNMRSDNMIPFAQSVHQAALAKQPWNKWQIVTLNMDDHKAVFYLHPKRSVKCFSAEKPLDNTTIIITNNKDLDRLQSILKNYQIIPAGQDSKDAVALVPKF